MGPTIITDSASINKYRNDIVHAIEELKQQFTKTERAIETVSESWKDDNFREFQEYFNEDKEQILPLCDVLNNYEGIILYELEEKIKIIENGTFHL